ncbi:hypothetical protein [Nocardia sp. NPDC003345]
MAWIESSAYAELIDDHRLIGQLKYQYAQARMSALDRTASVELVREIGQDLA